MSQVNLNGGGRRQSYEGCSNGGQNYDWNLLKGNATYADDSKVVNKAGLTPPVFVYDHEAAG